MDIYQLDPMGRTAPPRNAGPMWQPYAGEFISQVDLDPALLRDSAGNVRVITAERGSAQGLVMPAGIRYMRPAINFYSERYTGRPFDNCLICSTMTVLRWAGYGIPDGYDDVIRQAIPLPDPQGTTFAEVMRGVDKLFPSNPLRQMTLPEADLLANLKVVGKRGLHRSVYAVIVRTGKLPAHYQRLVGQGYDGLHGLALVAKQP